MAQGAEEPRRQILGLPNKPLRIYAKGWEGEDTRLRLEEGEGADMWGLGSHMPKEATGAATARGPREGKERLGPSPKERRGF
uniref:Uncharacterized protein n=1 Tax=Oryza sativa subsp. japonica TaxID=39947 RepID=Q6AVR4_ORYSJ|nr:hypothetical protein [Oryza sativa Japonica Group]